MTKVPVGGGVGGENGEESEKHDEELAEQSESSSSDEIGGINFDSSSMQCFKEIVLSSSSLFKHPLYYFPEPEDPGIFEAFRYEPPLEIDNDVGKERYLKICKQLNVVPLRRVLESLDGEILDLRYYGLRHNELRTICHALETNAYVKVLLLQDSWLNEETVHLLSNMLTHNETLLTLDLKECQIGAQGAQALNEGLQSSLTLRELNLSHNSIGDKGLRFLRPTFRNNESLRKINLGHNKLTSGSAAVLQQFFTHHEVIEDVNLQWNTLGAEEGFKKIATGLKANMNIKALNLSWNGLDSIGVARELGRYIRESTTLEFLDLSNNSFRGIPSLILKAAIGASTSLKCVRLGNNPLNVEEVAAFGLMLLQSEILETLDLENLYFHKSFNANLKKLKTAGKTFIYGGILGNYKIKGTRLREVVLKRCNYLGLAPRKAKAKRDFGHIALTFPEEVMTKADFEHFIRKKKKGRMYDPDLLTEMRKAFSIQKTKVNTKLLLSEYMKLYPDTVLPPPKPKKEKKGKKRRKTPGASTTATSTETTLVDRKVSFSTADKLGSSSFVSSKTDTSRGHEDQDKSVSGVQLESSTTRSVTVSEKSELQGEDGVSDKKSGVRIAEQVDVVEDK